MTTTKDDIRGWLIRARLKKATHLLVVCDTFDYEDYPVFIEKGDPRDYDPGKMQTIMECYALHLDWEMQLAEHRAHHWEMPPPEESLYKVDTSTPRRLYDSLLEKTGRTHEAVQAALAQEQRDRAAEFLADFSQDLTETEEVAKKGPYR